MRRTETWSELLRRTPDGREAHLWQERVDDKEVEGLAGIDGLDRDGVRQGNVLRRVRRHAERGDEVAENTTCRGVIVYDETTLAAEIGVLRRRVRVRLGRLGGRGDEVERERRAFSELGRDRDVSTHEQRELPRDCEAEARPAEELRRLRAVEIGRAHV